MINLFFNILVYIHISGLSFYVIYLYQIKYTDSTQDTIIEQAELADHSIFSKYLNLVYISTSLMLGIVEWYPRTNAEKIFFIIMEILSCAIFGIP